MSDETEHDDDFDGEVNATAEEVLAAFDGSHTEDGFYLFRIVREQVGGETVRVLLEPYRPDQMVSIKGGDEFLTGSLSMSPWEEIS